MQERNAEQVRSEQHLPLEAVAPRGQPSAIMLAVAASLELKGASVLFPLFFAFAREYKT